MNSEVNVVVLRPYYFHPKVKFKTFISHTSIRSNIQLSLLGYLFYFEQILALLVTQSFLLDPIG